MNPSRAYSMDVRSQGMAENRVAVQRAVVALAERQRLADISLADIAERSGVSVRTLLRYYGTKDELLRTVADELQRLPLADRPVLPGDVDGALAALSEDYETNGRLMLMLLAQEDVDPIAQLVTRRGKASHRRWVCAQFELDPEVDAEQIDLLVVCTDLYTWKLLRLDRRLSAPAVVARMAALVRAVQARSAGPATTTRRTRR
ncbi:MAG: TetR/AcrR family transcriptional regulator [Ilumatobacteraceae bacterium]